jgi:hypothetical protein
LLQRKCACGGTPGPTGECEECRKNKLQRKVQCSELETRNNSVAPPIVHEVLRSPGQPLDVETRAFMEPRFGHDFSQVRVHTDAHAAESAHMVNALAFTVGRDVVFGAGQYAPKTMAGKRLVAHELTHVAQQAGRDPNLQRRIWLGEMNNTYEHEADVAAANVVNGETLALEGTPSPVMLQRATICSKRLEAPGVGWVANHAYIDDTGRNDCLGKSTVGNYAVQTLVSGNFLRGCAAKTDRSTDPQSYTPNVKPCNPKPGVTDVSRCLRDAYNGYADPSIYANPWGPNSNTFASTLAGSCCADRSSSGLGWVPGWDHAPASPCPTATDRPPRCEPKYLGMGEYLGADCIVRVGPGPKF